MSTAGDGAGPALSGNDDVGLVLHAGGGRVDLVVSAIRDDNSDVELAVIDHGHAVEVRALLGLQVTVATLRWHVGSYFGIPDLESMIIAARGTVTSTFERVTVTPGSGVPDVPQDRPSVDPVRRRSDGRRAGAPAVPARSNGHAGDRRS